MGPYSKGRLNNNSTMTVGIGKQHEKEGRPSEAMDVGPAEVVGKNRESCRGSE